MKLYRMAQREIIGHKGSPREEISVELLELVAETRMGFAHKLLESMRKNPENANAWDDPQNQRKIEQEALRNDNAQPSIPSVPPAVVESNGLTLPAGDPPVSASQGTGAPAPAIMDHLRPNDRGS